MSITFRPVVEDDYEFLLRLYASTREQELNLTNWSSEQRDAFLRMQLDAQQAHYSSHYPEATHQIIVSDDVAAGRLYVLRREVQIRILDITILPELRNRGIGSSIINDLIAESEEKDTPLAIYVESFNPSLRLFERLGFSKADEQGLSYLMERRSDKLKATGND